LSKISKSHYHVSLAAIAVAFSLLGDMSVYAIIPVYYQELGLSALQVGIILSANRWIRILTNHLAERIIREANIVFVVVGVLITGSAIAISYGVFPVFIIILTGRLLWGFCWSILRHFGMMVAIHNSGDSNRGEIVGLLNGLSRIGSIAGTVLGGLLFDSIGYRLTFIILGLLSLTAVPFGFKAGKLERSSGKTNGLFYNKSKQRPDFGMLFAGFVNGCVGPGIIMSTLGFLLRQKLGQSLNIGHLAIGITTLNGFLLASRHILNTLGAPVLGGILDRLGHMKSLILFSLSGTLFLFAIVVIPNIFVILLLIVLLFICGVANQIALSSAAGKSGSRAYAHMATMMDVGAAAGPLLGWTLVELVSSPSAAFPVAGFLYAITTGIFIVVVVRKRSVKKA